MLVVAVRMVEAVVVATSDCRRSRFIEGTSNCTHARSSSSSFARSGGTSRTSGGSISSSRSRSSIVVVVVVM